MHARLTRLCLLAAMLGVLISTDGAEGVGSSVRVASIKPSPAKTHKMAARNDQPQLSGSLGDLLHHHHHHNHNHPDGGLKASTTIIRTTIITVTETTVMQRVSTKSITIFTSTQTVECSAKTEAQRLNAALADVIVSKPVSNKPPVLLSNNNPIYIPKPVVVKPVESTPVNNKPLDVKPAETKPVDDNPLEVKPVVDAKPVSNLNPVFVKPVSQSGSSPVSANLPNTSPVFVHKPNNVNKEFITLMAEFTALMEKLSAPKSQARLVGRFRSVSRKDEVWRSSDKEIHHEELSDELRLLVQQIKDVRTKPHDFYEHLETFVSYMEEI